MLKDRRTYEIMNAEDVGVPKSTLVLGKHSGRHAVQKRCEDLGLALSKFELDRVYRQMTALADRQKSIADAEIVAIVEAVRAGQDAALPTPQ
jgi:2-isopropylmalate synthase